MFLSIPFSLLYCSCSVSCFLCLPKSLSTLLSHLFSLFFTSLFYLPLFCSANLYTLSTHLFFLSPLHSYSVSLPSSLSNLYFTWPSCLPSPHTVASSTASVNAFKAQLEKMIGDEAHTHTHSHTHSYTHSQHPVVPDQIGSFMGLACPGLVWLGWMCGLNCADLA